VPPLPEKLADGTVVPPALAEVVMKCLSKSPDDRYPSAAALADALQPFSGEPAPPPRPALPAPSPEPSPRLSFSELEAIKPSKTPLVVAAVVGAALLGGILWAVATKF
jgi:serine/threonine-protein kinase